MHKLLKLLLFFVPVINTQAQTDQIWIFGNKAGVDFRSTPPQAILSAIHERAYMAEANASVCDDDGNLLFYTGGHNVWNRNHQIMPNGQALVPGYLSSQAPTESTSQGTLISPIPGYPERFIIFSLTSYESWRGSLSQLYYSVVDMTLDGGKGDIIPTKKGVLLDSYLLEPLTIVPGARCNYWVICSKVKENSNAVFQAFEVSASGINPIPVESSVGHTSLNAFAGMLSPSPTGRQVLSTRNVGFLAHDSAAVIYDFDPLTGVLSSPSVLLQRGAAQGACFSPDGSKVYVFHVSNSNGSLVDPVNHYISQFDVSLNSETAIRNSRTDWSVREITPLRSAPDGKVYFRTSSTILGGFNFPNLGGIAAEYIDSLIVAAPGSYFKHGFPNIIAPVPKNDTLMTASHIVGPCFANHIAVNGDYDTSGFNHIWNTGATTPTISVDAPGNYWVGYFTPPCHYRIDTFHVRLLSGKVPAVQAHPACKGNKNGLAFVIKEPEDTVNYSFLWTAGSDTISNSDTLSNVPPGNYNLHISTNDGCDTILEVLITEIDPRVTFELSDTLLCLEESVIFKNTSDNHFNQFLWVLEPGDLFQTRTPENYQFPNSGAYDVTLIGSGEFCRDTFSQRVIVDAPIVPHFSINPAALCMGQPVNLVPQTDSTIIAHRWRFGDQQIHGTFLKSKYQHSFDQPGVFPISLSIQPRACPDTSFTDSVHVYPLPELDLGRDTSIYLYSQAIYLKNLRSPPLNTYRHLWNTGDTTEVLKVIHPGTYTLSVISEPLGCTSTESIEVSKDRYIDIPNAFTPNGDGQNDYFLPRQLLGKNVNHFRMQIFNRWGQMVFETDRPDGRGWDGKLNNKPQPMGVYLYRIKVILLDGQKEDYKGSITLLR